MISIRKLSPEDAIEYQRCRLAALLDTPSAFGSSYEEEKLNTIETVRGKLVNQYGTEDNAMFGAFEGPTCIALTGIYRETRIRRRHKMWIVSVFVQPAYRRQSIAARLMRAAIDHARSREGVERIELGVESNNIAAKSLYESFGFVTWGREPAFAKFEGIEYDEDCMSLRL